MKKETKKIYWFKVSPGRFSYYRVWTSEREDLGILSKDELNELLEKANQPLV